LGPGSPPEDATLERWRALKRAASQVILQHGGTISHQHGVGLDHREFLTAERGPLGMQVLRAACRALDPQGMMNPGKLLEAEAARYARLWSQYYAPPE